MLSDSAILKKIEHQPKRTAGFKQLVRELGLHGEERQDLHERLDRLVRSGQLLKQGSDRYAIPQAAGKNLIVGRLSMHRDGFGFVLPDPTSLDDRLKARLSGDIFIPPPAVARRCTEIACLSRSAPSGLMAVQRDELSAPSTARTRLSSACFLLAIAIT